MLTVLANENFLVRLCTDAIVSRMALSRSRVQLRTMLRLCFLGPQKQSPCLILMLSYETNLQVYGINSAGSFRLVEMKVKV